MTSPSISSSLEGSSPDTPRSLSLSMEVDQLVEQVRTQSKDYAIIMRDLMATAERVEQDRIKVEEAYRHLRAESKRTIADIETSAQKTLATVALHAQDIEQLHGGLTAIKQYHEKIKNDSSIAEEYRKRMEAMFIDSDGRVKKMYEDIMPILENRLGQQIYTMREQIRNFENKLGDILEGQRRGFLRMEEELDNFKNKIPETGLIVKQTNRRLTEIVEESYKAVENRVAQLYDELEKAKHEVIKQSALLGTGDDNHHTGLQKKIDVLETKTYKLEQQVKEFNAAGKRATSIAIGVGIAGIILSLSLIFALK